MAINLNLLEQLRERIQYNYTSQSNYTIENFARNEENIPDPFSNSEEWSWGNLALVVPGVLMLIAVGGIVWQVLREKRRQNLEGQSPITRQIRSISQWSFFTPSHPSPSYPQDMPLTAPPPYEATDTYNSNSRPTSYSGHIHDEPLVYVDFPSDRFNGSSEGEEQRFITTPRP